MQLENFGQADDILEFLQGDFGEYNKQTIQALREINALKSANIIEKAIELLPKNGESFFKAATASEKETMRRFNSEFSNYPDGRLCDLYRVYANLHRGEFLA